MSLTYLRAPVNIQTRLQWLILCTSAQTLFHVKDCFYKYERNTVYAQGVVLIRTLYDQICALVLSLNDLPPLDQQYFNTFLSFFLFFLTEGSRWGVKISGSLQTLIVVASVFFCSFSRINQTCYGNTQSLDCFLIYEMSLCIICTVCAKQQLNW